MAGGKRSASIGKLQLLYMYSNWLIASKHRGNGLDASVTTILDRLWAHIDGNAGKRPRHAAAGLCLSARYRPHHHTGHALRNDRQFHRPPPARLLRREAAEALKRVQADLAQENLSLKVYDCYRPTRAVRAMEAWAHDGYDSETTRRFYPALHKRNLFALGYIASQSKHSTGTTVD